MTNQPTETLSRQDIDAALQQCAAEEGVRILYACESGSRAWGFPSLDSDYDVRFVYVQRLERYLSVAERRDVIERPISGSLDLGGWDVRKCFQLLRRGNPPLLEWLVSPIVYSEEPELIEPLRRLVADGFQPRPALHHYLGLAKRSMKTLDEEGESVRRKSYCYALRSMAAARYVVGDGPGRGARPPMTLGELLAAHPPPDEVELAIRALVATKAESTESDTMPRDAVLDQHLAREMEAIAALGAPDGGAPAEAGPFDAAFREILRRAGELRG